MRMMTILLSVLLLVGCSNANHDSYTWVENELIAHAGGGIDDITYTNSMEAFKNNYEKGHRLFEFDIAITSDNKLISRHDWGDLGQGFHQKVTYQEFITTPYYGQYTPLGFESILELMSEYEDVFVILDGKVESPEDVVRLYEVIGRAVKDVDSSIFNRLIPQMFYKEDAAVIRDYGFHDLVYVVGRETYTPESLVEFCNKNDISVVSLSRDRTNEALVQALKENDIYSYMYTLNEMDEINKYLDIGVHGFFTDFVSDLRFNDVEH